MRKLTRNQNKAVSAKRSVLVSGEAGTGKTYVLVHRLCRLISDGRVRPQEILVATPSARSAREIRRLVARMLSENDTQVDIGLLDAAIVAIYTFCTRVLRENAITAGLASGFSILSGARERILKAQILGHMLAERANELSVAELIQTLGESAVEDGVLSVHRHLREVSHTVHCPCNDPQPFLDAFLRCYSELLIPLEEPDAALDQVVEHAKSGLDNAITTARRLMASRANVFSWPDYRRLQQYRAPFRTADAGPVAGQLIRACRDALTGVLDACLDSESARFARLILDLALDFSHRYDSMRSREKVLDLDDLVEQTGLLLFRDGRITDVARFYRDEFRHVMLADADEMTIAQANIVRAVSRPNTLFEVRDGTETRTAGSGTWDTVTTHEAIRAHIRLQESFRSRRGLADFTDFLFSRIWAEDSEIEFHMPLCAGEFAPKSQPDVEIELVRKIGNESRDEVTAREAKAIAHRILEITGRTGEPPLILTGEGMAGRCASPADIVILMRSLYDLDILEQTLGEHGIRTCVLSVRSLIAASEVRDITCLLRVLLDPSDGVSLATVLRSPLFGVSEESVSRILDTSGENTACVSMSELIRELDDVPDIQRTERVRLERLRDVLDELSHGIRSNLSVTCLMNQLVERLNLDYVLLGMSGGRRRYANLRRLCEMAADVRASGADGLSEFIASIEVADRLPDSDVPQMSADSVRIMTVHRARGLQFPVVFVADMSRRLYQGPRPFVLDPEFGLAVRVPNPTSGVLQNPLCYRELSEISRDRLIAEEKRLFYIAVTRAQEHLVLVGSSDLRGRHKPTYREINSWTGWIEKALELGPGTPQGEIQAGKTRIILRYDTPIIPQTPAGPTPVTLADECGFELKGGLPVHRIHISPPAEDVARTVVERCVAAERHFEPRVSRLSVSQALDYVECPARFRFLHILGMPGEVPESFDEDEGRPLSAADLGHLVHNALETLDFSSDVSLQIPLVLSEITDESARDQVRPLLEWFAESPWCRELSEAVEIIRETPFEFVLGGRTLVGRMDVIYRNADGWTILDYKTGRAEDRERYELQVGIYALAASRLICDMPSRSALVLLSLGDQWVQDASDGAVARAAEERIVQINAGIDAGKFPPLPGRACAWCSFGEMCGRPGH